MQSPTLTHSPTHSTSYTTHMQSPTHPLTHSLYNLHHTYAIPHSPIHSNTNPPTHPPKTHSTPTHLPHTPSYSPTHKTPQNMKDNNYSRNSTHFLFLYTNCILYLMILCLHNYIIKRKLCSRRSLAIFLNVLKYTSTR